MWTQNRNFSQKWNRNPLRPVKFRSTSFLLKHIYWNDPRSPLIKIMEWFVAAVVPFVYVQEREDVKHRSLEANHQRDAFSFSVFDWKVEISSSHLLHQEHWEIQSVALHTSLLYCWSVKSITAALYLTWRSIFKVDTDRLLEEIRQIKANNFEYAFTVLLIS